MAISSPRPACCSACRRRCISSCLRAVGLVVAGMLVIFVLQNRGAVTQWLKARGESGAWNRLRNRFADVWHFLAIVYVVAVYCVWALNITGGFAFLFRATLLTFLLLFVVRMITAGISRMVERGFALSSELKARFPRPRVPRQPLSAAAAAHPVRRHLCRHRSVAAGSLGHRRLWLAGHGIRPASDPQPDYHRLHLPGRPAGDRDGQRHRRKLPAANGSAMPTIPTAARGCAPCCRWCATPSASCWWSWWR